MKPSGSVLALSFSVTAKEELEARIAAHAGPTIRANITVATIHGFCLGELVVPFGSYVAGRDLRLALPGSSAYDGAVSLTAAAFGIAGPQVQAFLKFRRRIPDGRSVKAGEESAPEIHRVVAAFWEKLLGSGYVDYPNALYIALQILRSREWIRQGIAARYPFLVVDEYQDCTDIQVAIIGELVKTGSRVFLVGDLYQCVYGFAGADADSLKAFATDIGARQLTLRGSHRCPQQVIDIAERVFKRGMYAEPDVRLDGLVSFGRRWSPIPTIEHLVRQCDAANISREEIAFIGSFNNRIEWIVKQLVSAGIPATPGRMRKDEEDWYGRLVDAYVLADRPLVLADIDELVNAVIAIVDLFAPSSAISRASRSVFTDLIPELILSARRLSEATLAQLVAPINEFVLNALRRRTLFDVRSWRQSNRA